MDREELADAGVSRLETGDARLAAAIGKEVELANALQKGGVEPHALVVALAKAWRGAELGDGDGLYGGEEAGYTALVAKRAEHFTIVKFGRVGGEELGPRTVLRVLQLQNRLDVDGDEVPTARAEVVLGTLFEAEGVRLLVLPPESRGDAMRAAGMTGPWERLSPRDRSAAARRWAEGRGAGPRDIVVSSWGGTVSRRKLFEFVENLPG